MKKLMTMMALAAMTMAVISCGNDDEPLREKKMSFDVDDLVTKTVSGNSAYDHAGGKLHFDLNLLSDTACLHVLETSYSRYMPTIQFTLNKLNAVYVNDHTFSLSGGNYEVMDGYKVDNVRCEVNKQLNTYYLTYDVVTSRGTSKVYTYPELLLTKLEDTGADYATTNELYMTFDCEPGSNGTYDGDVTLNNVQFRIGQNTSPTFKRIRIPYDEHVSVSGTTTGYVVEGTGITGMYLQGTTEVPFDRSTIDDLRINVNVVSKTYSIHFKCMGGEFSSEGSLNL